VGTTSVERSEEIGRLLDEDGIGYELLNAKPENVEREAEIVARRAAGRAPSRSRRTWPDAARTSSSAGTQSSWRV
jgi:hypothetical protein